MKVVPHIRHVIWTNYWLGELLHVLISRRARDSAVRYHRSNRLLFRSDEALAALYKINICKCHETSLGEDCTYRLAERVKHFGLNSPILEHETL